MYQGKWHEISISKWQYLADASVTQLVTIRLDFCRLVG
jgi:hypothetical protein